MIKIGRKQTENTKQVLKSSQEARLGAQTCNPRYRRACVRRTRCLRLGGIQTGSRPAWAISLKLKRAKRVRDIV